MAWTLRLRTDHFTACAHAKGWITQEDQARGLSVHQSSVSRIIKGAQRPGPSFIAAVLLAFPDAEFRDFFEIVEAEPMGRAA
jgi:hypothetical protein